MGIRYFAVSAVAVLLGICRTAAGVEKRANAAPVQIEIAAFVDLDGDGLNDNIPDLNHDGIPDFDDAAVPEPASIDLVDLGKAIPAVTTLTSPFLSNSDRFRGLRFCVRALCQNRGGFSSSDDFGPGNGIGLGAFSGQCSGGVCRF